MSAIRFELARITIEATSPLRVGTGKGTDVDDQVCVVDPNGMPSIPATSIIGVLRHAFEKRHAAQETKDLFGFQEGNVGTASRVSCSWGQLHGRDDRPLPFGAPGIRERKDLDFLSFLSGGVRREHVRISSRGVAEHQGKFDETLVPRGARFTFELQVNASEKGLPANVAIEELLDLLSSRSTYLGAGSRRGAGEFRVIRAFLWSFDLSLGEKKGTICGRRERKRLSSALENAIPPELIAVSKTFSQKTNSSPKELLAALELTPSDYWYFGGGTPRNTEEDKAKMLPVREQHLVWNNNVPEIRESLVVSETGLKGALRHRVRFHVDRLNKNFVSTGKEEEPAISRNLFGWTPSKRVLSAPKTRSPEIAAQEQEEGIRAGALFLSGASLELPENQIHRIDHVSLDRFTSGPIDSALFSEAPLYKGTLKLAIFLDHELFTHGTPADSGELKVLKEALRCTLRDLCNERLSFGAGANRGHGYCKGKVTGPLWDWLQGKLS